MFDEQNPNHEEGTYKGSSKPWIGKGHSQHPQPSGNQSGKGPGSSATPRATGEKLQGNKGRGSDAGQLQNLVVHGSKNGQYENHGQKMEKAIKPDPPKATIAPPAVQTAKLSSTDPRAEAAEMLRTKGKIYLISRLAAQKKIDSFNEKFLDNTTLADWVDNPAQAKF